MHQVILLLGGARSGKSDFSEGLAARCGGRVLYLATAETHDDEMRQRAAAHRARRPAQWRTVEAPLGVAAALEPFLGETDVILMDCLTLLASNVLIAEEQTGRAEERLHEELDALLGACERSGITLIIVSNEVGQGVVPAYALGRQYRDILGRANQRLAARADSVLFFIAGLPLDLKRLSAETLKETPKETLKVSKTFRVSAVVDLTHALGAGMPTWPGDPYVESGHWAGIGDAGYALRRLSCGEHSGTHIGVAAHLCEGGLTLEHLPVEQFIRSACALDFRLAAQRDADATLSVEDILTWESRYGRVEAGTVFLLATGWDRRWGDAAAYFNRDAGGTMHFPGFSAEAVRFLVGERAVAGLGTDAAGIDAGADATLAANAALLQGERFHLENLAHLERVPAVGATLFVGALPIVGGTGAPARVLALVP